MVHVLQGSTDIFLSCCFPRVLQIASFISIAITESSTLLILHAYFGCYYDIVYILQFASMEKRTNRLLLPIEGRHMREVGDRLFLLDRYQ